MPNKKNIFAETVAERLLDQRGPVDSFLKEMGIGAISAAAGIGNAAAGIGNAAAGIGNAASKRLKKSITDKATKKKKAPRAIPIHGPSDTRPAPKALPTSKLLNSPDARFRGYRIKLDKDGKETGVPYYAPPAKKR